MFGITRAPEINRPGLVWFNVEHPLPLAGLRGRLVVLDFWTLCCVNCIHVVPVLERLEAAYPDEVAVIGIHSPKFPHERDPETVRHAIARFGIRHPVVHDADKILWGEYCVRAWPTLAFISPDGMVIGELPGEPHPDLLVQGIGDMIKQFRGRGEIKPAALNVQPERDDGGALRFPGKIKPCPSVDGAKLWALADCGHHQIVVIEDDGTEVVRYGSGKPGWIDGGAEAAFNGPEGLACDIDYIYVADTRNHLIRRIDRASGMTDTIAGIGTRGAVLRNPEPGDGCALTSPWDMELENREQGAGRLIFTNTGTHQIAALDLTTGQVRPLAGTGGENIVDGSAEAALLAQPSGLALAADTLYFADAETSSIRALSLARSEVTTLAGSGLFESGHANGPLAQAKLQHPMGLSAAEGTLFVADSYNSTIRVIDLAAGTMADAAELRCIDLLCRPLSEPAGIASDGPNRLLVSDTNNHRVIEMLLDEGIIRTWLE